MNQKAPDTIDAESFASNLTLVKSLFPTMPEASVRRISWQIARSRASLADAAKEEGYSLDGTSAPAPPPTTATLAQTAAELASLKAKIAALRGPSPASAAADLPAGEIHQRAMALITVCTGMKYAAAIETVKRTVRGQK